MGKRSKAKLHSKHTQHAPDPAALHEEEEAAGRAAAVAQAHRRRIILLCTIPAATLALALGATYLLDSRPLMGIAIVAGILSWTLVLAANLGATIPPRSGQSTSGINFGRR